MSRRALAVALALLLALGFAWLGVWQVQRMHWKHALIAQVNARLAAAPAPVPSRSRWAAIGPDAAYTRVRATGRWVDRAPAFAQAVTEIGPGFWMLSPLDTGAGVILVNRGFVPADQRGRVAAPSGTAVVTGLLRMDEPDGGFLRSNDPAADRWYSRDTRAIGQARGLGPVAPFFIDADRAPGGGWPRGGMTVVRFRDSHLVYALTWFALAALALFGAWRFARERRGTRA